jgi:hypothetical protein
MAGQFEMNRRRFLMAVASLLPAALAVKLVPAKPAGQVITVHAKAFELTKIQVQVTGRGLQSGRIVTWIPDTVLGLGEEVGMISLGSPNEHEQVLVERIDIITSAVPERPTFELAGRDGP